MDEELLNKKLDLIISMLDARLFETKYYLFGDRQGIRNKIKSLKTEIEEMSTTNQ